MVKVNVYGIDGSIKDTIKLPEIFNTPYRPDIIKKSFWALMSNKRQPYGADPLAGMRHAVDWPGKGRGMARTPRLRGGTGRGAQAPNTVGGRRAHPPKAEKNWKEKVNKKEKRLSILSALASTSNSELVQARGHKFSDEITLPVVVDDSLKDIAKTKEVIELLKKIGVYDDVERAKDGTHVRAGRGKMRGRKYRKPKSLLIVSEEGSIHKSARNLPGVDIVSPEQLNIEHLAPGGVAGRLTLITLSALKYLEEKRWTLTR
ncbi:MAG: 50S ribosomal protein L4 [Thermoplasmata archaeon]|nr:50S ribosomal protein L4 [Thermoplasmata archaeon]RLF45994.1 MAG: 50S ribosomal protein L4 [Thermoplasmata archaeon]